MSEKRPNISGFREKMISGQLLAGTFVKTPSHDIVEVLALSGLDFVCFDAEHAPFDRARLDACLAMALALDLPALVRVASGTPENILQAIDMGAVGIVCPHVYSVEKAETLARAARFGLHGRGYAGSTRWAGFTTEKMPGLLEKSARETIFIAQIEEPKAVDAAADIAAIPGVDGLFLGPADLSVGYGKSDQLSNELMSALASVGKAAKDHGKAYMTFVPNVEAAQDWQKFGLTTFFIASEQTWMMNSAKTAADGIHAL